MGKRKKKKKHVIKKKIRRRKERLEKYQEKHENKMRDFLPKVEDL